MARTDQRVVRVFISSTFRDMFRERDILVKRIFPQLRKLCEERFVTWGEVDLRWGVPDEKKAEGKVLPICLEEIRRCRPYFVGILGERYGSLPEELPPDLLDREPWLKEHLKHSLTELEIWHGVLNDPQMAGRSFFYFRDPGFLNHLPKEANRTDFASESPGAADKLAKLKDRIRSSGLPVHVDYADPEALGELVLKDLTEVIGVLYPPGSEPAPLDREAMLHDAFARSRARVYIGRDEYFERLDEHVSGDGPPLVILGDSGSGKSALLANWALAYREKHKDDLLILHFIGGSPQSSDWAAMLRRIMGEFKRRFGLKDEIPDKPDALRAAFANWLHMASARGKVILILDALNQLEDRDGAPDLVWLPPVIPANVRLFLSTLPGRPLDDLKKRGWPTLTIQPLSKDERAEFITKYLLQYRKELSPAQASRIAAARQAESPLFLQALLEELRLFGRHEELEKRISLYLGAPSIPALYELILARYEADYEDARPGLVRDTFTAIWAARRGLSEAELLDILGRDGQPLARAHWSPLFLAAGQALVSKAGLLNFSHDFLRTAVLNRYLPGERGQDAAHIRLADHFEKQDSGPRRTAELPWQTMSAKAWDRLYAICTDETSFVALAEQDYEGLLHYWAMLEQHGYQPTSIVVFEQEYPAQYILHAARLLGDTGHYAESAVLWGDLQSFYRADAEASAAAIAGVAQACLKEGSLNEATALLDTLERSCPQPLAPAFAIDLLSMRAQVLREKGELEEALRLMRQVEKLLREHRDRDGLGANLGSQAVVLSDLQRYDEAIALMQEEERICRETGDHRGLAACLGNQGIAYRGKGDFTRALALHRTQEEIARRLGAKDWLARALGDQAIVHALLDQPDRAAALHAEEEAICRTTGDKAGLAMSLHNQAILVSSCGDIPAALKLFEEEEGIWREMGSPRWLKDCIFERASLLQRAGKEQAALTVYRECAELAEKQHDRAMMQRTFGNLSLILLNKGEAAKALEMARSQEDLCRLLGDQVDLARCLGNQARALLSLDDYDGALGALSESELICRQVHDHAGLRDCLNNQAHIFFEQGRFGEALVLHDEQEDICRKADDTDGLQMSLGNKAAVLMNLGREAEAMPFLKQQEDYCRAQHEWGWLARSLANQALIVAHEYKQPDRARKLCDEALTYATEADDDTLRRGVEQVRDSLFGLEFDAEPADARGDSTSVAESAELSLKEASVLADDCFRRCRWANAVAAYEGLLARGVSIRDVGVKLAESILNARPRLSATARARVERIVSDLDDIGEQVASECIRAKLGADRMMPGLRRPWWRLWG